MTFRRAVAVGVRKILTRNFCFFRFGAMVDEVYAELLYVDQQYIPWESKGINITYLHFDG
jgi:hypothetical protein